MKKFIKSAFAGMTMAIVLSLLPQTAAEAHWTELIDGYYYYEHPEITIDPTSISVDKKEVKVGEPVIIKVKVTRDIDTPINVSFDVQYTSGTSASWQNNWGTKEDDSDYWYTYYTPQSAGVYRLQEVIAFDAHRNAKSITGLPMTQPIHEDGVYDAVNMDRATFVAYDDTNYGTYTGMLNIDDNWRYVINGKVDWTYTGMACNEYGWWYYQNGQLDWNYTGMACNDYGWWYYRNGNLDWNYTGMACNDYGWWYYQNGRLDWNYTGMACNEYGWWYYRNGNLDWNYTGMACNDYGWWYYQNGNLDWNYTGMACNEYGWWYYQNGRLDWTYTGVGFNEYGGWFYYNGQIAWDYTGWWDGFYCVNGHLA